MGMIFLQNIKFRFGSRGLWPDLPSPFGRKFQFCCPGPLAGTHSPESTADTCCRIIAEYALINPALGPYYALINRARGPCEEIFVLTFKAYGSNAVRSMRLECQNKYFPYGPKSRLIRALLYTYPNKTV